MASGMKIALMFSLMAAMAMAVQAGSRNVSCTNKYCLPIMVNNVTIGVGLTLKVLVDDVAGILTCAVPDIHGHVVVSECSCPLEMATATIVEQGTPIIGQSPPIIEQGTPIIGQGSPIIEQGMDLVLVTMCGTKLPCPQIYMPPCILSSDPVVCL
jgi:hypothetical protein